jgi:hypothetical protein
MDPNGRIYHAPEDQIPAEDKARLDGYLRGRDEAETIAERKAAQAAKLERELARARAITERKS